LLLGLDQVALVQVLLSLQERLLALVLVHKVFGLLEAAVQGLPILSLVLEYLSQEAIILQLLVFLEHYRELGNYVGLLAKLAFQCFNNLLQV